MRINLLFPTFVIIFVLAFFLMNNQVQALDVSQIRSGGIVQINPQSLIILDDLTGNEIQIAADTKTVYDNIQKLADLKRGDKVQVEYQTSHSKNVASTITKVESEDNNEDDL